MTARTQDWKAVTDALEGLALKLKLHFEAASAEVEGDVDEATDAVRSAIDDLGDSIDHAFDGLRAAVDDPTMKEDVKQVATALCDALHNTIAEVRADLSARAHH
jgi:hypothetical protein